MFSQTGFSVTGGKNSRNSCVQMSGELCVILALVLYERICMTYFWLLCGATCYIFDTVLRCIQTFSWGSIFDRDLTFKGVLAAPVKRDSFAATLRNNADRSARHPQLLLPANAIMPT